MKFLEISDKFYNKGTILFCEKEKKIFDLNKNEIINIFEEKGVIIFRDYEITPENLLDFTGNFTKLYARDAPRRQNLYGKKNINTVDMGNNEMPLHSEASYSPSWPEILWFYCVIPSKLGGKTTLCDGIMLWKSLSNNTKNFFLSNPIVYELEFPVVKKKKEGGSKTWPMNSLGASHGIIDYKKGLLFIKQTRFAVSESRLENQLSFANHLLIIFKNEPQIKSLSLINGKKIPDTIIDEVKNISAKLTYDIDWHKKDLIMIDNKRFMHGRRSYKESEKREIINIQTLKANFSFGHSTRK